MSDSTAVGPSGQPLATAQSEQGEPYKWSSRTYDLVVSGSPISVTGDLFSIPLTHDRTVGRPAMVRGEVLITGQLAFSVTDPAATPWIEVIIVGYNGSLPIILLDRTIGGVSPALWFRFGESDTYERIGVQASVTLPLQNPADTITLAQVQANALLWR
jgi:hypothetical protein